MAGPQRGPASSGTGSVPPSSSLASSDSLPGFPAASRPASSGALSGVILPLSGQPSLRPASAVCYIPHCAKMDAAVEELRSALIATVAGYRVHVSAEEVSEALLACFNLPPW